jgi:hypothetical protein
MMEEDMSALCWHGKGDVRVDAVPDPVIQHLRDAISGSRAARFAGGSSFARGLPAVDGGGVTFWVTRIARPAVGRQFRVSAPMNSP